MRVLVFPRDLELGGSSINALDLAAAMRGYGHEVVVFSNPGPLEDRLKWQELTFEPVRLPLSPRPSPSVISAVSRTIRKYSVDLVHTYEYWPCVEAFYGAARSGVALLATILSMGVPTYLPRSVPLTVGTRDLVDQAKRDRTSAVHLLEPPIDTSLDHPDVDPTDFIQAFGLDEADAELTVAIVTRVARNMKQESIERSIDAVARLASTLRLRLLVVGDGSAMDAISERADRVNAAVGRRVVILTGAMRDPRPAYAAADIVVGMGSSVLRGMAIGKPAVVVGEQGFTLPVAPETMPVFDRTGFYGVGPGRPTEDDDPLAGHLSALAADPARRWELGDFGHKLVKERYSLEAIAASLDRIYRETAQTTPSVANRIADGLATAARVVRHKAADRGILTRRTRVRRPELEIPG